MTRPLVLLAHGAGVGSDSEWMKGWARRLGTLGDVVAFDYPYMAAGRRRPDRMPVLVEAHRDALVRAREGREGPVVLVGKSMGSRVGCHLALEEPVTALVCLGYPMVNRKGDRRDQVLVDLEAPVMFVQGTRDPLCPLPILAEVRERMTAPSRVLEVQGGDHSLVLRKRDLAARGITQAQADLEALEAIRLFLDAYI